MLRRLFLSANSKSNNWEIFRGFRHLQGEKLSKGLVLLYSIDISVPEDSLLDGSCFLRSIKTPGKPHLLIMP